MLKKYHLFTLFLLFSLAMSTQYILWFGPSQTGKSSSIRLLTGQSDIKVGASGGGESTTTEFAIFEEKKSRLGRPYKHIDSVGMFDNKFTLTDSQILNKTQRLILDTYNGNQPGVIRAIIVTEAYSSPSVQFPVVLGKISTIFGTIPQKSIILALTKKNTVQASNLKLADSRRQLIEKMAKKYGISNNQIIDFLTPSSDYGISESSLPYSQFKKLGNAV